MEIKQLTLIKKSNNPKGLYHDNHGSEAVAEGSYEIKEVGYNIPFVKLRYPMGITQFILEQDFKSLYLEDVPTGESTIKRKYQPAGYNR